MSIEANIRDAIADLNREGIDALEGIAADYGIKADVLRARFEKNGTPMKPVDMAAKVTEAVASAAARYGVPVSATNVYLTKTGEKVTVICHVGRTTYIVVRHTTAQVYRYGAGHFTAASIRASEAMRNAA